MPNRAVSKAQWRLMKAVASGAKLRDKPAGLSKADAAEFIGDQSPAGLPEHVKIEPKRNSYRRGRRR